MSSFAPILSSAIDRHGEAAVQARIDGLPALVDPATVPDDRWLSGMALHVFSAGFVWRVIRSKWDGFEAAFEGFDPDAIAAWDTDDLDRLLRDERIVRNGQKIRATVQNAAMLREVAAEHGSFGAFVAAWPADDPVGLWQWLARNGSRLGGSTGPYMLRRLGVDTFLLSNDVLAALRHAGVAVGKGTSARDQRAAQQAFLAWRAETGRSLSALSSIAALSIDG